MAEGDRKYPREVGFRKNERYISWVHDTHSYAHMHTYTCTHTWMSKGKISALRMDITK